MVVVYERERERERVFVAYLLGSLFHLAELAPRRAMNEIYLLMYSIFGTHQIYFHSA